MAKAKPEIVTRYTKTTLPTKTCVACGRPFAWRKKWARVWDEVRYCSDRCRASGAKVTASDPTT